MGAPPERVGAVLALLLNAFIWGVSWWPFRQLADAGLHALWATAGVYLLAAVAIEAWRPGSLRATWRARSVWWLGLAAGITNACFNWGVAIGDVVRVVLLFYLMPLWAVLLARMVLGEPVTVGALARIALALAGAVVVLKPPGAEWPVPRGLPDLLALAGGFAFALTNVMLRREHARPDAVRATAMFVGGVVVPGGLAAALATGGALAWPPAPATDWLAGTALLGLAFIAANFALQHGAARLPSGVTSVVLLSEVVFAALSAVLLGGAALESRTLAGGAMIIGASLWSALAASRAPKEA